MEHPRLRESTEIAVRIQGDDVGNPVLDQQGADQRVGIRHLVLNDADVGVLGLEVRDHLVEVLERLSLELEEVERGHPVGGAARAAAQADSESCRGDHGDRAERTFVCLILICAPPCAIGAVACVQEIDVSSTTVACWGYCTGGRRPTASSSRPVRTVSCWVHASGD